MSKGISKLGVFAGGAGGLFGGTWAAVRLTRGRNWKAKNVLLLSTGLQVGGGVAVIKYLRWPSVGLGMIASGGVSGLAYATASMVHQRADVPALANAGDNIAGGFLALTNPEVIFALNDGIDRLPAGATTQQIADALSAAQVQAMNGPPQNQQLPSGGSGSSSGSGTPQPIVWNAR